MSTKILVIEDENSLRAEVVEILELEGYDVVEAENGGIAFGMLQNIQPDIIICDIAMPDFDGYQILQHVRSNERLELVPFIFVTARTDRSFVRHGMELGADDYLTKPFSRNELLASIESRLARFNKVSGRSNKSGELDDAKRQLTSMVAHELRTPLVSMTMIHELISQKLDDLSGDEMRDLLKMMQSGNQRMQHLVEQMVVFTQLNTNVITAETVQKHGQALDIQMIIQNAIEQGRIFAYRNQDGTIKRAQNKPFASVNALIKPLSFALAELIANALIFSPPNSSVIIQERLVDDWVHVNIVDSGAGLTTNRLKKASLPFEQIDRENQEQQGMGMGLPLAIKIVDIHGGNISFQSTSSGGTQVIVKLPLFSS